MEDLVQAGLRHSTRRQVAHKQLTLRLELLLLHAVHLWSNSKSGQPKGDKMSGVGAYASVLACVRLQSRFWEMYHVRSAIKASATQQTGLSAANQDMFEG